MSSMTKDSTVKRKIHPVVHSTAPLVMFTYRMIMGSGDAYLKVIECSVELSWKTFLIWWWRSFGTNIFRTLRTRAKEGDERV